MKKVEIDVRTRVVSQLEGYLADVCEFIDQRYMAATAAAAIDTQPLGVDCQ